MSSRLSHAAFDITPVVVDLTDNSTTVTSTASLLHSVFLNSTLAAACVIKNGSTTVYTIPAAAAAGTRIEFGAFFSDGIVIDPGDAETGTMTVMYKQRV